MSKIYLRDRIEHFLNTRSNRELIRIYQIDGKKGLSLACKVAGLNLKEGKRRVGLTENHGEASMLAAKECGCKTQKIKL